LPKFELLGGHDDETRLLLERTSGYSLTIPGHPELGTIQADGPRYDVVVDLRDVRAHLGFRIDDLPTLLEPMALAKTLAMSYATSRASKPPFIKPLPTTMRPASSTGGAHAVYPLRDAEEPTIEQLWIVVRPSPTGLWVLYQTTWFHIADLNTIKWGHFRSSMVDQHAWDPAQPCERPAKIWPESAIATQSAKLDLTEDAWREAAAKATEAGPLTESQIMTVGDILREFAQTDQPPRTELVEPVVDAVRARISMGCPPRAAAVLLRNLGQCRTMLDLRAWTWQCAWAVGNLKSAN
jgi:hypothetical protein